MITTTKGLMDESLLRRVDGGVNNANEQTTWVEYWDGDELVHRSVHVALKPSDHAAVIGAALAGVTPQEGT